MTKLTRTLMIISATGFAVGTVIDCSHAEMHPSWSLVLPLGAVAFGAFLTSLMLEKEMAKFGEEEANKFKQLGRSKKTAADRSLFQSSPPSSIDEVAHEL